MRSRMPVVSRSPASNSDGRAAEVKVKIVALKKKEALVLVLVVPKDSRAVRNKDNILAWYDLMIDKKRPEEAAAKFVAPGYIQHNPLIPTGGDALGKFFGQTLKERARPRVKIHKVIAIGNYVWAHVTFINLFNDDPEDTGVAGVDIYKMDADGKAIEHWDVVQVVGTPASAANWYAPNIPAANSNGMF
jgi:predicted SnoaL-like aldol condensation-catalyzing enzyme